MPVAAALVLPLVMAGVLLASGIAKIREPDDLDGWAELGVPRLFRRRWLVRLHPWAEIALALALVVLGGVLGVLAALVCLTLMAGYLALVIRTLRAAPDASCSCFGTRRPVTRLTAARNAWLTVVAAVTVAVIWRAPTFGGALAGITGVHAWAWVAVAAVAVLTALVIVWPDAIVPASSAVPPSPIVGDDEDEDYVRVRTPAVPVTLADGAVVNLRRLATARPLLLLAVSPGCAACALVIDHTPVWRDRLPELDIRFLLSAAPGQASLTERDEPQSLHDPHGYVRESIGEWSTPTAVLLGADGLLAGGPITGGDAIAAFVEDIRASLDELRAEPHAVSESGSAFP